MPKLNSVQPAKQSKSNERESQQNFIAGRKRAQSVSVPANNAPGPQENSHVWEEIVGQLDAIVQQHPRAGASNSNRSAIAMPIISGENVYENKSSNNGHGPSVYINSIASSHTAARAQSNPAGSLNKQLRNIPPPPIPSLDKEIAPPSRGESLRVRDIPLRRNRPPLPLLDMSLAGPPASTKYKNRPKSASVVNNSRRKSHDVRKSSTQSAAEGDGGKDPSTQKDSRNSRLITVDFGPHKIQGKDRVGGAVNRMLKEQAEELSQARAQLQEYKNFMIHVANAVKNQDSNHKQTVAELNEVIKYLCRKARQLHCEVIPPRGQGDVGMSPNVGCDNISSAVKCSLSQVSIKQVNDTAPNVSLPRLQLESARKTMSLDFAPEINAHQAVCGWAQPADASKHSSQILNLSLQTGTESAEVVSQLKEELLEARSKADRYKKMLIKVLKANPDDKGTPSLPPTRAESIADSDSGVSTSPTHEHSPTSSDAVVPLHQSTHLILRVTEKLRRKSQLVNDLQSQLHQLQVQLQQEKTAESKELARLTGKQALDRANQNLDAATKQLEVESHRVKKLESELEKLTARHKDDSATIQRLFKMVVEYRNMKTSQSPAPVENPSNKQRPLTVNPAVEQLESLQTSLQLNKANQRILEQESEIAYLNLKLQHPASPSKGTKPIQTVNPQTSDTAGLFISTPPVIIPQLSLRKL